MSRFGKEESRFVFSDLGGPGLNWVFRLVLQRGEGWMSLYLRILVDGMVMADTEIERRRISVW